MDEQGIGLFLKVLQHGSLRQAAKALYLSEPSLNAKIRRLEEDLGVCLLDRTHHGVEPTPQGTLLAQMAQRYLTACHDIRTALQVSVQQPALQIGVTPDIGAYLLPSVLSGWIEHTGNMAFTVCACHPPELQQGLQSGRFNLAILRTPGRFPNLAVRPLLEEPLVMITSHADHVRIPLAQIRQWDVLAPVRDYHAWQILRAFFDSHAVWPRSVVHINHPDLIKNTVAANSRLYGVVPEMVLPPESTHPSPLHPVIFEDKTLPWIPVFAAWRRDSETRLLQRFLEVLQAAANLRSASRWLHTATPPPPQ